MANELADTGVLDAASLKAERLPELAGRLADKTVRIILHLFSWPSAADAQTGLSAVGHHTNSAQNGGQYPGSGSTFAGTAQTDSPEQWLDVPRYAGRKMDRTACAPN